MPRPRTNSTQKNRRKINVNKEAGANAQLLAQLSTPTIPIEAKTKLTPTMKNILYIGGTAIAIVIGYALIKKFKNK